MAETAPVVLPVKGSLEAYFQDFQNTPAWHIAALAAATALGAAAMHFSMRGGGLSGAPAMARCRKTKKYERCVRAVKKSGHANPWAVCTTSVCG